MSAAQHEAAHSVAIHLLVLQDVLCPGGAAVHGANGIITLGASTPPTPGDLAAILERVTAAVPVCTLPVIEAAREFPHLVPDLLMFLLAGYGAEARDWRGDFSKTITVRTSSDYATARQIILDLFDFTGMTAETMASEIVFDALERAVDWASQPHARALIDAAAAYLAEHQAATWAELLTIFTQTENAGDETLTPPGCGPDENLLAEVQSGAVGDGRPPLMAKSNGAVVTNNELAER